LLCGGGAGDLKTFGEGSAEKKGPNFGGHREKAKTIIVKKAVIKKTNGRYRGSALD